MGQFLTSPLDDETSICFMEKELCEYGKGFHIRMSTKTLAPSCEPVSSLDRADI